MDVTGPITSLDLYLVILWVTLVSVILWRVSVTPHSHKTDAPPPPRRPWVGINRVNRKR